MYREDHEMILQAMVAMYPRPLDADELYRLTGIDPTRMRRAMWGLVTGGFVEMFGSPSWIGLPRRWPRVSEAGMAVGAGLATLDERADDVIGRLEYQAASQLQALRCSAAQTASRPDAFEAKESAPRARRNACDGVAEDRCPRIAEPRVA